MTYVALSRVTKLDGLHLVDFDKPKIVCDHNAVAEYNRLRSLYAAHLGQLEVVPATKTDDKADRNKDESSAKCCNKAARKTSKKSKTEQLHKVLQRPQQPDCEQVDIVHTGTEEHNIYHYCQVTSVGEEFMRRTCERLNLKFHESANRTQTANSDAAVSLERELRTKTGQQINVTLNRIIGDGNCLFRALSLAITRSQKQHGLLRSYVVNHMMDDSVRGAMEQLFATREQSSRQFTDHLVNMEQPGVWGTEQEIAAAAHLFDCSIITYSKYSSHNFCLQHFPPHFTMTPNCNNTCQHHTIYLINSSGSHYETATVTLPSLDNEP